MVIKLSKSSLLPLTAYAVRKGYFTHLHRVRELQKTNKRTKKTRTFMGTPFIFRRRDNCDWHSFQSISTTLGNFFSWYSPSKFNIDCGSVMIYGLTLRGCQICFRCYLVELCPSQKWRIASQICSRQMLTTFPFDRFRAKQWSQLQPNGRLSYEHGRPKFFVLGDRTGDQTSKTQTLP